jgi:hypothetical protein
MSLRKNGLRVFGLCIMAALGLMAFSAVSAQAAGEFYIKENEKLLSFAEHKIMSETIEARIEELGKLTVAGLGIVIGCDALHLLSGATASVGGFLLGQVLYLECVVLDLEGKLLSKCAAQDNKNKSTGKIETEKVLGEVFLHPAPSGAPFILFKPDEGTVFATVEVTGVECAAKGSYPVEGDAVFSATSTEALWLLIKAQNNEALFPTAKLKFGERKATIAGSAEIKLAGALNDKFWGAL